MTDGTPLLGAHFSIAGGLENAIAQARALDCNVVQLFTKNARAWKEKSVTENEAAAFKRARNAAGIKKIYSHCTYLINIAAPDPEKRERSQQALVNEMKRSAALGLDGVVLHPGAHLGAGEAAGVKTAAQVLNRVLNQSGSMGNGHFPCLLMETTAGQGTGLGSDFFQIAELINRLDRPDAAGVCLDTSHVFAAGYDIRTPDAYEKTMARFNRAIGLARLRAIHVNDSKTALGSNADRHEHIGRGHIGETGFRLIMSDPRLQGIPKILETPKTNDGREMDPVNLKMLRSFI